MNKRSTREDYANRIGRVLAHIHANLDAPLDTERLAEIACFSPFHWHRIYQGMMGESVGQTVRRVRLHRAAIALVESDHQIADIAREAGYGSLAAFTRAFKATYSLPPAAYRKRGWVPSGFVLPELQGADMSDVTVTTLPPMTLAAMPHKGSYLEIGPTFGALMGLAGSKGLLGPDTRMLGVYYDDPSTTPAEELRSEACVVVPEGTQLDQDGVRIIQMPGGRHAVARHVGPYEELMTAYHRLFTAWLPDSGEEAADRPCFEIYLNTPQDTPAAELITDVHLPLQN